MAYEQRVRIPYVAVDDYTTNKNCAKPGRAPNSTEVYDLRVTV